MINSFYLSPMIMEQLKAIVNLRCKCPICGGDAITMTRAQADKRRMHLVHDNEYYAHYSWGDKHYLVRQVPSETITELSLC